jgi:hypothetical protein
VNDYKTKSVPDALKGAAASILDPMKGTSKKMTYRFNSEDEVAVTYQGKTDVLKREASTE